MSGDTIEIEWEFDPGDYVSNPVPYMYGDPVSASVSAILNLYIEEFTYTVVSNHKITRYN